MCYQCGFFMRNFLNFISALSIITCSMLLNADEKAEAPSVKKEAQTIDIAKISEAYGHLLGKSLQNSGVKLDIAKLIKGVQDSAAGKESPMSEVECVQAITAAQEKVFKEQSQDNLKKAENFLQDNAKDKKVVSLENGKVQYRIEKEGSGTLLETHFSPLIRYTGKFLDGSVFSASNEEEKIYLEEMIPGLRSGLIGMKEGEKRIVYIHPELAYGSNGYFPPNSLLTFEIELVQANAPSLEGNDAQPPSGNESKKPSSEVADTETHIR